MVIYSVPQYSTYTTKSHSRLVRTPISCIHYQETWSSSPFSNYIYSPPRDLVVQSVFQYRTYPTKRFGHLVRTPIHTYTTKRRGRLVHTPISYVQYQETWSSSPCSNTVHTLPRDVMSSPFPNTVHTLPRDVLNYYMLNYRTYSTKRRGRLVRAPKPYQPTNIEG